MLALVADRMFGDGEPVRLGRYVVLSRLGSGGAGVVYAAHDPDLDRRVALKVVASSHLGDASSHGRERLLREARALAQLSHPNVVAVHDVGTLDDGQVYIAMALVDGEPLDRWLAAEPRAWHRVVEVFVEAARGLVAAHDAGLVHRDFKPSNVLVGSDGVTRVVDFGLARFVEHASEPRSDSDEPSDDTTSGPSLTRTGSVLGTPLYMAPEQHRGEPADARSDQFSFCAALYEALYGQRPFEGPALGTAKARGEVRPPPAGRSLPRWLVRLVARGLSPDPARRHPDMRAVLAELSRRRVGPRAVLGGAALGAVAIAAAWGAWPRPPAPCGEDALAEAWSDAAREGLAAAMARPDGTPHPSWPAIERTVDGYATAWRDAWRGSCEATAVHRTQSEALGDQRTACLVRLRRDLTAMLDALSTPRADPAVRAGPAILGLVQPRACDADAVERRVPVGSAALDPEARAAVETHLAVAGAALATGDVAGALEEGEAAYDGARALGFEPLLAEAQLVRGRANSRAARHDEALAALDDAVALAMRSRSESVEAAARGWRTLVLHRLGRGEQALAGLGETEAAAWRCDDPARLAFALRAAAEIHLRLGDRAAALAAAARAVEAAAREGEGSLDVAEARIAWAAVLGEDGRLAEAEAQLRGAIATMEPLLGEHHPRLAIARFNLGSVLFDRGRHAEALVEHEAALQLRESALAPEHPELADSLMGVAGARMALGELRPAIAMTERALRIYEGAHGPEHPDSVWARWSLGLLHVRAGRVDEGLAGLREADGLSAQLYGEDGGRRGESLEALGTALAELGRPAEAEPLLRRAAELARVTLGPEHPRTEALHATLAGVQAGSGAP